MKMHVPSYWSHFGSSRSQTLERGELGKDIIIDLMMESPFVFTDGSYLSNPGPGGEVIYSPHHKAIPLTKPVCKRGFILLGELVAILITVEYFMEQSEESPGKVMKILRDSQATVRF